MTKEEEERAREVAPHLYESLTEIIALIEETGEAQRHGSDLWVQVLMAKETCCHVWKGEMR